MPSTNTQKLFLTNLGHPRYWIASPKKDGARGTRTDSYMDKFDRSFTKQTTDQNWTDKRKLDDKYFNKEKSLISRIDYVFSTCIIISIKGLISHLSNNMLHKNHMTLDLPFSRVKPRHSKTSQTQLSRQLNASKTMGWNSYSSSIVVTPHLTLARISYKTVRQGCPLQSGNKFHCNRIYLHSRLYRVEHQARLR